MREDSSLRVQAKRTDQGRACLRGALLAIFVVMFLASSGLAEEKRDGYYWITIPDSEKLDIILGMFDGIALNENVIAVVIKEHYTICSDLITSIMHQTDRYLDNLTTSQISESMDRFYAEEQNRSIPIYWGVWVVARESKGDKSVDKFVKELRKAYK
jgi:hypothetical protein